MTVNLFDLFLTFDQPKGQKLHISCLDTSIYIHMCKTDKKCENPTMMSFVLQL